jgi:hypothetical protein
VTGSEAIRQAIVRQKARGYSGGGFHGQCGGQRGLLGFHAGRADLPAGHDHRLDRHFCGDSQL